MKRLVYAFLFLSLTACISIRRPSSLDTASFHFGTGNYTSGELLMGFPLKRFRISRGFAPFRKSHYGVDFVAPRGTSVLSAHNGKVIFAGTGFRGYGKLVVVEHPDGIASFYAHLNSISVSQGQIVRRGHKLGGVGATGNARGVHLHFELKIANQAVDPMIHLRHLD